MREQPAAFGDWLIFFLRALRMQKRALEAKVDVERSMLQLSEAQQKVLDAVALKGRMTVPQLVTKLKRKSPPSAAYAPPTHFIRIRGSTF